jgi:arsenite methyltransferase
MLCLAKATTILKGSAISNSAPFVFNAISVLSAGCSSRSSSWRLTSSLGYLGLDVTGCFPALSRIYKNKICRRSRTIHGDPTTDDFVIPQANSAASTDSWSEWLLRRRHGGDANYQPVVLDFVERIRDRVLDGAGISAGMVLVDVGAGNGLIAFGAFARAGPSLSAVLVDVSAPLLKRAEQVAIECGVRTQCTFLQTSAERLDGVGDECADVVTTRAVLAYVADKAAAARQFHRVLKPGGCISIAEPIYQDEAVRLATLTDFLLSRPADLSNAAARLIQRWRAAQLPSTMAEIKGNPLTNFSERDLIVLMQEAVFTQIHLELHIDIVKAIPVPWDTFIDIAPLPGAPTLRELFLSQFSDIEQGQIEEGLRGQVESGQLMERSTIAYLTARKQM